MRKMRKALSLVLVLALVLGSFSMVFAADNDTVLSDVAGLKGEDQILVAQNLGIITGNPDGTYQPEKAVNRAEFAAIITRALAIPESAMAGYSATVFKDTDGYGWAKGYLGYCQAKGIMIGDGQGNAMPGRTITVNEAVTMVCRALGYVDSAAELVGIWPSNYVTLGQNLGLYTDLSGEATITKENAAILIYNALTVQKVAINSLGNTDKLEIDDPNNPGTDIPATMLNTGLGCTAQDKQVLGTGYTFDDSLINIANRIGSYGTPYTNKDGELVAFSTESTMMTGYIDGEKFVSNDKKYSFAQDAGTVRQSVVTAGGAYFWNTSTMTVALANVAVGTVPNASPAAALVDAFATGVNGTGTDGEDVTLSVKVAGTTIKDVYALVGWAATTADMISASDVEAIEDDQNIMGTDFALNDDDEIDLRGFALVGVNGLDAIEADDVVYVYRDDDDNVRKIAVGQEVVEGVIDSVSADEFEVDATAYEYAGDYLNAPLAKGATDSDAILGADAVVSLDAFGFAFDIDTTGGDVGTFGVVIDRDAATGFNNGKVKIYTSADDDEMIIPFAKASKIKVYENNSGTANTTMDTFGELNTYVTAAPTLVNSFIGYKLDSNGAINYMKRSYVATGTQMVVKSAKILAFGGKSYEIAKDAVVMTHDGTNYAVSSMANMDFTESKKGGAGQFVLNNNNKVLAMFVPKAWAEGDEDVIFAAVNTVSEVKSTHNDDTVNRVSAIVFGTGAATLTTTNAGNIYGDAVLNNSNIPTLIRMVKNGDGDVKGWEVYNDTTMQAAPFSYTDSVEVAMNRVATRSAVSAGNWVKDASGNMWPISSDAQFLKATKSGGVWKYEATNASVPVDARFWIYEARDAEDDLTGIGNVVIYTEAASTFALSDATAPVSITLTTGAGLTAGTQYVYDPTGYTGAAAFNAAVASPGVAAADDTLKLNVVAAPGTHVDITFEGNPYTNNTATSGLNTGAYVFEVTVTEAGCADLVYEITVTLT